MNKVMKQKMVECQIIISTSLTLLYRTDVAVKTKILFTKC